MFVEQFFELSSGLGDAAGIVFGNCRRVDFLKRIGSLPDYDGGSREQR